MILIQALPKIDWTILPISVLSVIALVYVGVWAASKLGITSKPKTFAEEGELYWDRLRLIVREELDKNESSYRGRRS
jgi:hypothetical protein